MKDTFDILILNARPAAGKSEIISFLGKTSPPERRKRFHLGELREIDDFPIAAGLLIPPALKIEVSADTRQGLNILRALPNFRFIGTCL